VQVRGSVELNKKVIADKGRRGHETDVEVKLFTCLSIRVYLTILANNRPEFIDSLGDLLADESSEEKRGVVEDQVGDLDDDDF
jgi:hypothetical protein